jgi:methylmalonyl-CoA mutase N-terminal domain/subunit
MDEALALPTEQAVQVALRTQQVLAYEAGAGDTLDPLAGSYAVEALTDRIEDLARAYLKRIGEMGGMLAAIEGGYVQREIQDAAYHAQRAIDQKESIVVGVNAFQAEEAETLERLRVDPSVEATQRQRLAALRARRDSARTAASLDRLESASCGSENLMPLFIEAVEADATLGEICGRLRRTWGEYQATSVW